VSIRDAIMSGDPAACTTQRLATGDGQPVDAARPARFRYEPFRSLHAAARACCAAR
jgi:hypothetical protein